jgi:hypothetical protein
MMREAIAAAAGRISPRGERLYQNIQAVAPAKRSRHDYLGENTLARHDAVADLLENGAAVVAFLADLGHLEHHLAVAQTGADGQGGQFEAFGGDVFGKGSRVEFQSMGAHDGDGFFGQQADLAMPVTGMGVTDHAMVDFEFNLDSTGSLLTPFSLADIQVLR